MSSFDFAKKIQAHPEHIAKIKNGKRPFPITLELDLTDRCNHRCFFCYTPEDDKKTKAQAETARILFLLDEARRLGVKGISYTGGGEPMLHPGFYEIIRYGKKLGFDQGLMTNGSAITMKGCKDLCRSLQWLRISIGGGNREAYKSVQGVDQFDRIVDNLDTLVQQRNLLQSDTVVGVRMLMLERNYKSLPDFMDTLHDRNILIDYLQLAPNQFAKHNVFDNHKSFFEKIHKNKSWFLKILQSGYKLKQRKDYPQKCYAHFCQMCIKANGDVQFCKNTRDYKGFAIGNIYNKSLEEIWYSKVVKELEKNIRPNNCGVFCKNSVLNESLEWICNPPKDIQINFVN